MNKETLEKVKEVFSRHASEEEISEPQSEDLEAKSPDEVDPATLAALEQTAPPEGDTPEIPIDLEQLSRTLGFDKDALSVHDGTIRVRTKVDGESFDKSLEDLVTGYQLREHTTRKSQKLAEEREAWERQRREEHERLTRQAKVVTDLLDSEKKSIEERYKGLDWDKLRVSNPSEYAALMADYQREMAAVDGRMRELYEASEKTRQTQEKEYREQLEKTKQIERERLLTRLKWTSDTMAENGKRVANYLISDDVGYSADEVGQIFDHRFIVMAEKARQWDNLQKKVSKLKDKQVQTVPKVPAGAVKSSPQPSQKQSLIDRAKATGRPRDKAMAAVEILRSHRQR